MKNKKNEEKKKYIWKKVAIGVTAIFALVIIIGLIKAYYIRSSLIKPTQAQIDYAEKIATQKLQSMGIDSSAFQIQVGRKMRILHNNGIARNIMQVAFYNNSTTHTYLVDVNSGEILLQTETDLYGTLANNKMYDHRESSHPWMEYPKFFRQK